MLSTSLTPPGLITTAQDQVHLEWSTIPVYTESPTFHKIPQCHANRDSWSPCIFPVFQTFISLGYGAVSLRPLPLCMFLICYPLFSSSASTNSAWHRWLLLILPTLVLALSWITYLCFMFWTDVTAVSLTISPPIPMLPGFSLSVAQCCSGFERPCFAVEHLWICLQSCVTLAWTLFFFLVKKFFFYWSRVDLQCCVSFRCTAKWISYTYTYNQSFLDSFPI